MGTEAWRNWRAADEGEVERENYDDELQSDVAFVGGPVNFGPYTLSLVIREHERVGEMGPAVILHGSVHTTLVPDPRCWWRTGEARL